MNTSYKILSQTDGKIKNFSREDLELDLTKLNGHLSWEEIFKNSNPVEVEIGFGKGRFLIEVALTHPTINYLGIEKTLGVVNITQKKIIRRGGISNIRLIRGEAYYTISNFIKDSSVHGYHIYFPDPWWKRKHKKRKLFKEAFIKELERTLVKEGNLYIATDVEDYFYEIMKLIKSHSFLIPFEGDMEKVWQDKNLPLTGHQIKYEEAGKKIYKACFTKVKG